MSGDISLCNLVNLSIGTPEVGAVNFNALHAVLHAILGHLKIQNVTIAWNPEDPPSQLPYCQPQTRSPSEKAAPTGSTTAATGVPYYHHMEEKLRQIEKQIAMVESLPTGTDFLQPTSSSSTPVDDMWQLMQLRRKIQSNEDGISQSMALIQDLLREIYDVKQSRDKLKEEVKELRHQLQEVNAGDLAATVNVLEKCCRRMDELEAVTISLRKTVVQLPDPEDLGQFVTWDVMQSALLSEQEILQKELAGSEATNLAIGAGLTPMPPDINPTTTISEPHDTGLSSSVSPLKVPGTPLSPSNPTIPAKPSSTPRHSAVPKTAPPPTLPAANNANTGVAAHAVGSQQDDAPSGLDETPLSIAAPLVSSVLPQQTPSGMDREGVCMPLSRVTSGIDRYSETVEALKNIGKLTEKHDSLEVRIMAVEESKVDQIQLVHLEELTANIGARDLPDNLTDQLNRLRAAVHNLTSGRETNVELMNAMQKEISQLQAECEKLHSTTWQLVDDHNQMQSHIELLFKSMKEMEEKKADKQLVEMEIDIKADKCALENKVSRVQFDTMTEQLSSMFHELLSKVTGQEQDWHKVIDKLSKEMECKLNRIELDSVKKQLEDRWNSIRKNLQAQPAPEHEDAAGIRRHLVTVPCVPGLPSHRSSRPYTVYELEQVRQHYRSLWPGTNLCNYAKASSDQSMSRLLKMHMTPCRQVERVQGQQIRHHEQSPSKGNMREITTCCLPILSPLQRTGQSGPKHERIPEMMDYSYLAMSRSCGGSHTLTYPNRRYTRQQHITHVLQAEVDAQPLSTSRLQFQLEEVELLGLDGHIYKGRLNTRAVKNSDARLPMIFPKDGVCKSRDKVPRSQSQSQRSDGIPVRPQSAKSSRSRSVSNSSMRDWPVSVLGCMSQGSVADGSPRADPGAEPPQGTELRLNPGPDEEPLTNL